MSISSRAGRGLVILVVALSLAGCGSREERMQAYVKRGESFLAKDQFAKAGVELRNALQIEPKNAKAHYLLGTVLEHNGDLRGAYGQYKAAADLDAKYVAPREKLARIYLAVRQPEKARAEVKEILALKPQDPGALTVRAAILATEGKKKEALAQAQALFAKDPKNADAAILLANLYADVGPKAKAGETLEAAIRANPENIPLRLWLARFYAVEKQPDQAERVYREVIKLAPDNLNYRTALAAFYAQTGRLGEAEKTLRDATRINPDDAKPYLVLADFLARRKSLAEAEHELQTASAAHPDLYDLRFALAQLYAQAKNTEKAKAVYEKLIADKGQDPANPVGLRARDALAALYASEGKFDRAQGLVDEVLKNNPGDNGALLLKGKIALHEGHPLTAVSAFRSLLKDQPDSVEVLTLLAMAHLQNHQPDLARENLQRAAQLHPKDPGARVRLARFFIQSGEPKRALDEVDKGLKVAPKNLELLALKAGLLARGGDAAGAKAALDTIVAEYPGNPLGYQGLAGLYAAQGHLDAAVREYDRALKVAPKNPALLQQKAAVLARQKKFDRAAAVLAQLIADYPKSPLGYFRLGELYFARKDYPKARAQFELALTRAGKDAIKPLEAIVQTDLAEKQPSRAIASVRAFLKEQPDNAAAYVLLGNLYAGQKDYAQAQTALRKASALKPAWPTPYLDLSKVHLAQKQPAAALADVQAGLKQQSKSLPLLFAKAALEQESGDADAAVATYRKVLEISPKNVLASNNLAMLLATRKGDPKAMKEAVALAKALEGVRNAAVQDTVGWVYYQSGDAAKAVSVLEPVAKAAPKVPIFQYHLGMALYKAGKTAAAKTHLERAVVKGAEYPGLDEARKVLASLK